MLHSYPALNPLGLALSSSQWGMVTIAPFSTARPPHHLGCVLTLPWMVGPLGPCRCPGKGPRDCCFSRVSGQRL